MPRSGIIETAAAWILLRYELWSFIIRESSPVGDKMQVTLVSQANLKFHFVKVGDFRLAAAGKKDKSVVI